MFLLFKLIRPLVLVAVLAGAYFFAPAIGDVSDKTLERHVAGELDAQPGKCSKRGIVTWRCSVVAGGTATYSVRLRGRCWTARRTARGGAGGAAPPSRASGCVHLRDQAYALAGIG